MLFPHGGECWTCEPPLAVSVPVSLQLNFPVSTGVLGPEGL